MVIDVILSWCKERWPARTKCILFQLVRRHFTARPGVACATGRALLSFSCTGNLWPFCASSLMYRGQRDLNKVVLNFLPSESKQKGLLTFFF